MLDYTSFIGLFVYYLAGLRPPPNSLGHHHATTLLPAPHAPPPSPCVVAAPPFGITLILGGYSYGSLLTTYLPSVTILLDRFACASDGTPEARIKSQALDLAAQWNQSTASVDAARARTSVGVPDLITAQPTQPGFMSMGGEAPGREGQQRTSVESGKSFDFVRQSLDRSRRRLGLRKSGSGFQRSRPSTAGEAAAASTHDHVILSQICYLLISPLLPPVSLFATMFSKLDDHHAIHSPSSAAPLTPPNIPHPPAQHDSLSPPDRNLASHPTLAIYGTQDFFCSHRKLRTWAENLATQPHSRFRFREISHAGHFWQEGGADRELRRGIREWLVDVVVGIQEHGVVAL